MVDIDGYVREAVQAKIQKDIEDRVYEKIKGELRGWKFLGVSGSVVGGFLLAGIIAFHQPLFAFVVDRGGADFRAGIKNLIADDQKKLDETQAELKVRTALARDDLEKLTANAAHHRDEAVAISGQIEKKLQVLEHESDRIDELVKKQKDIMDALVIAQDRVTTALSKLAEAGTEVENISKRYNEITAELTAKKVIPASSFGPTPTTSAFSSPQARSTVYFQFAGFTREEAVKISDAISQKGWQIPGQQRTGQAVGTNEIRFNPKDAETAQLLKDDSDAALQGLNLGITLTLQPNPIVKAGIPEVWIFKR
jgi:hypothetical protein